MRSGIEAEITFIALEIQRALEDSHIRCCYRDVVTACYVVLWANMSESEKCGW